MLRHADASSVEITVTQTDGELHVTVVDDGRAAVDDQGVRPAAAGAADRGLGLLGRRTVAVEPEVVSPTSGNGLRGIRERATALGGDADAGPLPDGGWQVMARLPVEAGSTARRRGGGS